MSVLDQFKLDGRTAVVTGASRGIGRSIAVALAECGADVIIHYAGNEVMAQEVAQLVRARGCRAALVQCDLADDDAPVRLVRESIAAFGKIDILVLNASQQVRRPWSEVTREEHTRQMNINFRSAFETIQAALPDMIRRRWGRVLTIGSVQQTVPSSMMPIYAASKAALLNLVRNLAREVAPMGVNINNLAPGVIATDRNSEVLDDPNRRTAVLKRIPVGFVGEPSDCTAAAVLLCSEASRYITGADFYVDGGWSLA